MTTTNASQHADARDEQDVLRSQQYAFLSRVLYRVPGSDFLSAISKMSGDESPLGRAYGALALRAARVEPEAVEREFFELFVGVGRGELLPYASFYQTGFLNERPLAEVRDEMARLGLQRADGRFEPEDHIAALFEVMAGLSAGRIIPANGVDEAGFFARHIAPWAGQFFDDLTIAPSADFYRPVAEVGRIFTEIEARAFALAA